ncbi:cytochrome P450 [Obba rivulosa]|uniref:Cytochrome P450 n=1 Tax=Obba rivulosa TaxID=1052685 RepID=A0A8E2DLW2_9APHY|nr:cytochrome P450 [Obba rivulosa]
MMHIIPFFASTIVLSDLQLGSIILLSIFLILKRYRHTKVSRGLPYPPGPPGKPFVGSISEIAQYEAPRALARYREQYGDLVMLQGLGNKILVLNSLQAINDLLDQRGSIYSCRPNSVFGGELMGMKDGTLYLQHGEEWHAHRKLAHTVLGPAYVKQFFEMQEGIAATLAKSLIENPVEFFPLVRMSAGRIILGVLYGIPPSAAQTEYILLGERLMEVAAKATAAGKYLCDLLPFLKYAPACVPFQREAQIGRDLFFDFMTKPFHYVKHNITACSTYPSLVPTMLSSPPEDVSDLEKRLLWTTGALFAAGAETTYATVLSFILAMALNPEVQKKAQAEIEKVIGSRRLPAMHDRQGLPYVEAVVKETMRWQPSAPLSVPRRSDAHDYYQGYFIPKDTVIVPNIWAIAYAPNAKYNPEAFIPERFLDPEQPAVDPKLWAFGFGRRKCPGLYLGDNSVFILIATLLAAFDISPPKDSELVQEFTQHIVRFPKPYSCRIVPRSNAVVNLVEARAASSVM